MPAADNVADGSRAPNWRQTASRTLKVQSARVLRRLRSTESTWRSGRAKEIDWWSRAVSSEQNNPIFREKMDPATVLGDEILEFLPTGDPVRILDVGAGPMTRLGKTAPGRLLEITATDALADEYDAMLAEANITPLVRTIRCETEKLTEMFEPNSFDVVYARNTIDHHYDAEAALRQMLIAVRPGGVVILWHRENEAQRANYHGMHQFNFTLEAGLPVVWNRKRRIELTQLFAGQALMRHAEQVRRGEKDFIHIVFEKVQ